MDISTFKKKNELIRLINSGTYTLANSNNVFGLAIGTVINLEDEEFVITDKFLYEEIKAKTSKKTGYSWEEYTITSIKNPSVVWFLEVEKDDKLYISLTKEKFNASRIEKISNKKVQYNNEVFYLDETSKAICTKFSTNESWEVTLADFESDNDELLSIETWEDGNEEAFFYIEVPVRAIKILK